MQNAKKGNENNREVDGSFDSEKRRLDDSQEVPLFEYLMTEHEDDTKFGNKLARFNKCLMRFMEGMQVVAFAVINFLNYITSPGRLFILSWVVVIASIFIVRFIR